MFGWGKKPFKPTVFALGKMAGHPEFLPAPDPLASALDQWLDAGWQAAHGLSGRTWEESFLAGSTYGFIWSHGSKAREVTCGVVAPGGDSIGRHYPFVVASRMESARLERGWSFLPLASAAFFDEAHSLMVESQTTGLSSSELTQRLIHLPVPVPGDIDATEEAQCAWNADTSVEVGWRPIFPDDPVESATRALGTLVEALRPWVRREWPSTPLVLRLPLGGRGPAPAVVWLEAVQAILRWRQTIPTAFWAAEGESLLVSLGPPSSSLLRELWGVGPDEDHVVDLVRAVPTASPSLDVRPTGSMADCLKLLEGAV